uniref:Large ribosomal subunit protein P2 n=1 Tax=Ditylenchus dipsaci TaxID=166011 RepID=A0A915CZU1_9BILA
MKYLAAYMLCAIAGKENPSFKNIQGVLAAGGLDVDAENAHLDKKLEEVIAAGEKKLASVPSGGGGAVPVAASAPDSSKPAAVAAPAVLFIFVRPRLRSK